MNSITEQELHSDLKQKIDKIDQLEKTQTNNKDIEQIKKDIDSLKSSVDNGKTNLYSAIVGKKVTPRSKDFDSLVQGVNSIQTENLEQNKKYESQIQQLNTEKSQLQNQIKSIKPAKGNAQPYQVSENATFTNESGELQKGILKTTAVLNIKPSKEKQTFNIGIYGSINVEPITKELVDNIGFNMYKKQEFYAEPKTISHRSTENWSFTCSFIPNHIIILDHIFSLNSTITVGNNRDNGIDKDSTKLGGQFLELTASKSGYTINISIYNSWKRDSCTTNRLKIIALDINNLL